MGQWKMFRSMRPVISSISTHFRLDAVWLNRWYKEGLPEDTRDQRQKATFRAAILLDSKGQWSHLLGGLDTAPCLVRLPPPSPSRLVYGKTVIFFSSFGGGNRKFSHDLIQLFQGQLGMKPGHVIRLQTHHVLQQVVEILEDVPQHLDERDRVKAICLLCQIFSEWPSCLLLPEPFWGSTELL